MRLQSIVEAVFPPDCLSCGGHVDAAFAICGDCWGDTPFILGSACDVCGTGMPGQVPDEGELLVCEECHADPRPWSRGRAVMAYNDNGRKLVLAMKHGDRADIARAAGKWLARAAADLIDDETLVVPVPLHWLRLAKRRFNQAALLAQAFANEAGLEVSPQALMRPRATPSQGGKGREARFVNVDQAIVPHPRHSQVLRDRNVLLVDDVMTSGATFSVATEACLDAGAKNVCVLALARVGSEP